MDDFEEHRGHLLAVAYRMLGSPTEAEDAVQEAWLRMNRTDVSDVRNMRGWLTTVVARICLDMLRVRGARPEQPLDDALAGPPTAIDPEQEALLADSVGAALLVVLQRLSPRSGWRSCCTTCSTCRSPRSRPSSGDRRTPQPS